MCSRFGAARNSRKAVDVASRQQWTNLTDAQLLAQCEVDTYRASGPGGQKRNKTSSAVRLRHLPSGLLVIAEESRSQHENKAKALRRLQRAFYLELREPRSMDAPLPDELLAAIDDGHRFTLPSAKDPRFWPAIGVVLDLLDSCEARVAEVAEAIGTSTGNLIDFLQIDPKAWQTANQLRVKHGQKPLR